MSLDIGTDVAGESDRWRWNELRFRDLVYDFSVIYPKFQCCDLQILVAIYGLSLRFTDSRCDLRIIVAIYRFSLRFTDYRCDLRIRVAIYGYALRFTDTRCDIRIHVAIYVFALRFSYSRCDFGKSQCESVYRIAIFKNRVAILETDLRFWGSRCDFYFALRFFNILRWQFYRVNVGIQSPDGVTTTHGLKKAYPKKSLPPAPPKGLLRLKSRALLEERRCSLEEWMTKLLSDIDLSRSVTVASFLELEAATRSSFQELNDCSSEDNTVGNSTILSNNVPPNSSISHFAGSSSITSDYGSDTAYETSELGTPRLGRDDSSEIGLGDLTLDEDLTVSIEKLVKCGMSNIDEGLFMGQAILEQLEDFPKHKSHAIHMNNTMGKDIYNGNGSRASSIAGNRLELFSEIEPAKVAGHARKLSTESVGSVGSDVSSLRGSDISISGIPNSSVNSSRDLPGTAEILNAMGTLGNSDPRHCKTDMEDLIARLNQEIAVKGYLTTKVKDLEVELENTKQKSKEKLQQAILIERERFTQMQWEMEDLRRKSLEMELKLNPKRDEKQMTETTNQSVAEEKDAMLQELNATKEQLNDISKRYEELEAKSKADIKVLVKEVKSLRKSQKELKQEVGQSLSEKSEAEAQLEQERQKIKHVRNAREKLLNDCRLLHNQLLECSVNISTDEDLIKESSSIEEALDLLTTSDDKITLLLVEVQLLAKREGSDAGNINSQYYNQYDTGTDDELRKIIADIFTENAKLRKQVNSHLQHRLESHEHDDDRIKIEDGAMMGLNMSNSDRDVCRQLGACLEFQTSLKKENQDSMQFSMSDELQLCLALPTPNHHHGLDRLKGKSCLGDKGYRVKNKRGSEQTSGNLNDHECNAMPLLLWSDHPNEEDDEYKDKKKTAFAIDDMNDAEEDQVVGWPPIKSWRKRTLHHHQHHHQHERDEQIGNGNNGRSIYVKVKMEGVPIARKIDLRHYHSYHQLTNSLITMFTQNKTRGEDDYSTRYTLTYQDNEGD
ncbi:kinesin-like protein KIF20B-like isoform X2 [Hibiscus syriacus]|uniref:Auxin-responsive protein n=1 Tax=Hibiscus syriacus TaxID=106335 RepID=A0A6A2WR23_HIBSY|nr:kinesin-like protein KIF20B-like isoform X2 [Hibiscus syriacus]